MPITQTDKIYIETESLIYKYYNDWSQLEPFEREARFHIDYIRIHPFEDGNGRTSRLILNYNLLKQGIAPVIITTDLIEYYHRCIREDDIESMKKIFMIQSTSENKIVEMLFFFVNDCKILTCYIFLFSSNDIIRMEKMLETLNKRSKL